MFNNKIALKLSKYFAMVLLIFSVIVGLVFMFLFRNYTINVHKAELDNRAVKIAETLSSYTTGSQGGYGAYMRFIGDIAGTDVWIVDENLNLITSSMGQGMMGGGYEYKDLPLNAENLIKEVFTDKTVFSQDFSGVLSETTLTIGTPIKNRNGIVIGVVLLHSPVYGTNSAILQGFIVLVISILIALVIVILLSIALSLTFTKPLNKIRNIALQLVNSNYTEKTNIKQDDEIGQLASTIDILADRLDEASQQNVRLDQIRKDFVSNISHELKTPVTVIRGSLEALIEKIVTDPIQIEDYHKQMLSETLFLQRLIGELLELSKLQNIDFTIEKQEISLYEVISEVTRSACQIADKKRVKILIDVDSKNSNYYGDYGRLRQMIMIVLDNAIKFSPDNGIVQVKYKDKILSIIDKGLGIKKEEIPFIFDRFYKSRSEQNKIGTGLGLAIAKEIAIRHNIEIEVESNELNGTKFIFYMNNTKK